jgi:hypothetical protein
VKSRVLARGVRAMCAIPVPPRQFATLGPALSFSAEPMEASLNEEALARFLLRSVKCDTFET